MTTRTRSSGPCTNQLAASAQAGARGVKVWKDLGLTRTDASGALVKPDDERVVRVLQTAGDLGLPVLIHTADPVAFFDPLDETNERIDELTRVPEWWFGGDQYPTFAELLESLDRLIGACPQTTFIGAHVGCWAEDLAGVGRMLNAHPNWHVDLGGRLAEIGRQPRAFARFVEDFPDRVLFGTDEYPPSRGAYERYYRFLQTADEHFAYSDEVPPPQGRWQIYGCELVAPTPRGGLLGNAQRDSRAALGLFSGWEPSGSRPWGHAAFVASNFSGATDVIQSNVENISSSRTRCKTAASRSRPGA